MTPTPVVVDAPTEPALRLLIHHHALAHEDRDGIWVQSFIGAWVRALASRGAQVGLLLATSPTRLVQQDVCLTGSNVVLHDLGARTEGRRWRRNATVAGVCRSVASSYDVLLIRGMTPRQALVHAESAVPRRAFLLVGSPIGSDPGWALSPVRLLGKYLYHRRLREFLRVARTSQVAANSAAAIEELAEAFGVRAALVSTNTISADDFVNPRVRPRRPHPELLFCGRVVPDKGIEDLLLAIARLSATGPMCRLMIVGECQAAYRVHLDRLVAELGLTTQVAFRGFVPFGDGLLALYREADLYVLPSWHEGFPHSIWEAAASGTPIVTTPVGGIGRLLTDGHVVFATPRDPAALSEAIGLALSEPAQAHARAVAVHCLARDYTVERSAARLIEWLHQGGR